MLNKYPQEQAFLQKEFEENGYIIVEDVFSKEELNTFSDVLQTLVNLTLKRVKDTEALAGGIYTLDEGLMMLRQIDPIHISMIQMTISRSPEFFRLASNLKMARIIKALFGLDNNGLLYEVSNGVVFTMPNDAQNKHDSNMDLFWHKDTFYTIPRSKFLQIWAPLIHESNEKIGTLKVCPGSHKNGFGKQCFNPSVGFNHRYTVDPTEINRYQPKSIHLELGQLLIFDGRLIHGSGNNTSSYVRTSILGLFHDVSNEDFVPTAIEYKYLEQTPEAYFYEIFKDENIKPLINEQSAFPAHFD